MPTTDGFTCEMVVVKVSASCADAGIAMANRAQANAITAPRAHTLMSRSVNN